MATVTSARRASVPYRGPGKDQAKKRTCRSTFLHIKYKANVPLYFEDAVLSHVSVSANLQGGVLYVVCGQIVRHPYFRSVIRPRANLQMHGPPRHLPSSFCHVLPSAPIDPRGRSRVGVERLVPKPVPTACLLLLALEHRGRGLHRGLTGSAAGLGGAHTRARGVELEARRGGERGGELL
eukprot:scaffold123844_cov36-Phaeocystis_antarctica.AAC.1